MEQDSTGRYLITIGSPDCPRLNFPSLPNVESDIEKIVQLFTHSQQGYERVLSDQIPVGARSDEIKNGLSQWFASSDRKASDCVIIYYAGHGDEGYEGSLVGDHYLFTVDSRKNNLSNTAIATRSLIESLFQGNNDYPRNVLLILDVCYAGIGQRQSSEVLSRLRNLNSGGSGFWIMASSTDTSAGDGAFVVALEKAMQFEHNRDREFLAIDDLTQIINQHFKDKEQFQRVSVNATGLQKQAPFVRNPHFTRLPKSPFQLQNRDTLSSTSINRYKEPMNESTLTATDIELTSTFKASFEDFAIKFAHRNREKVSFNDLFVFPDLKKIEESLDALPSQIKGEKLFGCSNRMLIFGSEQTGKTTLAKKLFYEALANQFLPLFITGAEIRSSKTEDLIQKLICATYFNITPSEFLQRENIVCIIDDLSASSLNKKAKNTFINNLNSTFARVIIFDDESFHFLAPDFSSLDNYKQLEILPFNNVRRNNLVEKWVLLDSTEETDEQQIWKKKDELRLHVESIVHKGIVPAKPLHILMILQSFETMTVQKLELTAYGHCYQYFIYQALERARVQQGDFDTYINVLTELADTMLDSASEYLSESKLNEFFEAYSNKFLSVDRDKVVKNLIQSSILENSDIGLKFRYRYLFYFFAAKKLAESLYRGDRAKQLIKYLVDTIHLEKSSNIILFLTHHSKDQWVLDEILLCVMEIFLDENQIALEPKSLTFLQNFVKEIPDIVIEARDAREERLKEDVELDNFEEKYGNQENEIDEENLSDLVVNVNKLFRSVEVCGQILRNRIGSMERSSLEDIYEESLSVSLRFLNLFLRYSEFVKEEAIRRIIRTVNEEPALSDSQIIREVESFYLTMNYLVVLGMLYKTGYSLGSARGHDIYIKVAEKRKDPASRLVQAIIELQFEKKLDVKKIEKLNDSFEKNPVCKRFLKHIVVMYIHRHDVSFRERQQIADKLNIPIKVQRSLQLSQSKFIS